jgi:hypothetical protein
MCPKQLVGYSARFGPQCRDQVTNRHVVMSLLHRQLNRSDQKMLNPRGTGWLSPIHSRAHYRDMLEDGSQELDAGGARSLKQSVEFGTLSTSQL